MKISELQNFKKILLVGYGKEGKATHAFLKSHVPNAIIDTADIKDGPEYLGKQNEYDLVIKSPGIHKSVITAPYTTATNIFFANVQSMIIGITGTKGKSTTTSLIYEILESAGKKVTPAGNIGKPMIEELSREIHPEEVFVVELSSYQLDDIKYSPHISVVINLFPEHMNYHGGVEEYFLSKKNIISHAKPNDYFVYNPYFSVLQRWAKEASCKTIPYITTVPFDIAKMKLLGEHNQENVRAAVTVGQILGVPNEVMQRAVLNFQPLPHRLQLVGEFKGVTFYDDAISTTPESTIAAISALKNVGTIFLGGLNRGYEFAPLISSLKKYNIKNIVLFPESGTQIKELLAKETEYKPKMFETTDMKEAVSFAYQSTPQESICLLSNASPSYSIWKNFEEKGNLFQQYIKELATQ